MGDVLWNLEYAVQLEETSSLTDIDENSTNHIADIPLSPLESFTNSISMVGGVKSGTDDDAEDTATSAVFSQLVNPRGRQTKIHNIGATLVGVDKFRNKYYERLEGTQYGRHRWVEYGDKGRYNASQVPPEWHGWLHFITDHTGNELLMLKPKRYGIEHRPNFSGEGEEYIYHSKGHALNPGGQRDWTRYQPWQPAKTEE